ncbi:MAG: ATP-binding cassette domain-containing protein, partial [Isosphaeraceae bacterium]
SVVLEAEGIRGWRGLQVDHLTVHAGEILGIAGQSGSGRSRLAAVLAGAYKTVGHLRVDGQPITPGNVLSARKAGVAYIPEDRREGAILGSQPVSMNLLVGNNDPQLRLGPFRRFEQERTHGRALIEKFDIRPPDPERLACLLSGGNQQKIVVARALSNSPKVVIADEPTQGVDANARAAIHAALLQAAASGTALVAVCSEFEELFDLCDRIVVLRDGQVVLDRQRSQLTPDEVLAASLGSHSHLPATVPPSKEPLL